MNYTLRQKKGFTLVELLIVIALIAILSVAVLATINPIEQSNKAKDSTVQNDAAEVMNSYERYYANSQKYPWMKFSDSDTVTVESAVLYRSDQAGFGICYAAATAASTASTADCPTTGDNLGLLVAADELKSSFAGKSEFQDVVSGATARHQENALWTFKDAGSGGSIYVCYIPKAKSNRQKIDKLYCLNNADPPSRVKAGTGTCTAPTTGSDAWGDTTLGVGAELGKFLCVPE